MNRKEIFTHYTNLIEKMMRENEFWKIYFQDPFCIVNDIEIPWYKVRCGAYRGCLIDDDYPYVVKWQLTGEGDECEKEEYIYNRACEVGLEKYFTEAIFLGTYETSVFTFSSADYSETAVNEKFPNDVELAAILHTMVSFGYEQDTHPIRIRLWAYPKAESARTKIAINHIATCDEARHSPLGLNLEVGRAWIDEIGLDEYRRLSEFLADYEVDDLHSGNIAMINGHLVIIDYAGAC